MSDFVRTEVFSGTTTLDALQARVHELEATIAADAEERRDVEEALRHSEARLAGQAAALEMALTDLPLADVLNRVVRAARELAGPESGSALFRVDEVGAHLRFTAASGLADDYTRAVDGFEITPTNPWCGSAAYTGEVVIVRDVASDPLWSPFSELARAHGIAACWSFPIRSHDRVVGTLAVYHRTPREPHMRDIASIELLARTAALIIERDEAAAERTRAEAELRQARDAAERASAAKSQFLAMMSHELRTTLTGVIGYSDLLATEVLGPMTATQQEALSRVKASTWHLVGIIDEILTLSRAESGREEIHRETTDIAALTREVVRLIRPPSDGGRLTVRVAAADPELITTDPGKVRQILINLVGNAVKYTAEGDVSVELDRADADRVMIHVRDSGPGIDPQDQERIFEAFTQVDGSIRRDGSGVGLGLAISRHLAGLLGGDILLQSTPGAGSTFTLRLPRTDA